MCLPDAFIMDWPQTFWDAIHYWLWYVTFLLLDGKWLCLSFRFLYLVIVGRGRAGRDTPRSLRSDVERDRVRLRYVLPESPVSAWCAVWVYTAPDSQTTRSIHSPHRIQLKHIDVEAKAMIYTNVISSSNRQKCHIIPFDHFSCNFFVTIFHPPSETSDYTGCFTAAVVVVVPLRPLCVWNEV